jgi:hypothetical protein
MSAQSSIVVKETKRELQEILNMNEKSSNDLLYNQDLGTQGTKPGDKWDKTLNIAGFKVTKRENKRRKLRKVWASF